MARTARPDSPFASRALSFATCLFATVALAVPDASGDTGVWGTRAGEVMVLASAQFSEESDERLWHLPLETAVVHDSGVLRLQLRDGPGLFLPIAAGSEQAELDRILGGQGQLLRLEYHPAKKTPRGRVHASWTMTPRHAIAGDGFVPVANQLYSAMLRFVGDEIPDTGVFAPLARAQDRLDLVVRNVTAGNGREVDELADDFLEAVDDAGLPLEFYRLPEGRASAAAIQRLRDRGHVLSAVDYWNAAISRFRQNRIVNPALNEFQDAWALCPTDTRERVEVPGRGRRLLSDDLLLEFRKIAGQKYLDAALSAAHGEDPDWTMEMLRRFREEHVSSGLPLSEFRVEGRPGSEAELEYVAKLARRETGFVGFFRSIWHKILEASMPKAPSAV